MRVPVGVVVVSIKITMYVQNVPPSSFNVVTNCVAPRRVCGFTFIPSPPGHHWAFLGS